MITKCWVCLLCVMAFCSGSRAQNLVANSSFEIGTQVPGVNGAFSELVSGSNFAPAGGSLSNWTVSTTAPAANASAGHFFPSPGGNNWTTKLWNGDNIGYLQISGAGTVTLSQTLSATLQNDTTYSLHYEIGRRKFSPNCYFEVKIIAGSTLLASQNLLFGSTGQELWVTDIPGNFYPKYISGSNNPHAGESLKVEVSVIGQAGVITEAFFDTVELTADLSTTAVPSIQQGGIVPVFSSSNTIQPGSWISIYGKNFIGNSVLWKNDFPTTLGGVSVKINGKPAYIWYASRTQINVQAPSDTATGAALVTVTTPQGTASGVVTLGAYGPSLSLLDGTHAAAIVVTPGKPGNSGAGYDIIGPAGSSLGYPTRPVKAGETIVLYGVGFGPTNPTVPSGLAFFGNAPCVNPPKISIGGLPAVVNFAGLVSAGLYQLNVVVPPTGSGDQPLQALAGGLLTPPFAVVAVQ